MFLVQDSNQQRLLFHPICWCPTLKGMRDDACNMVQPASCQTESSPPRILINWWAQGWGITWHFSAHSALTFPKLICIYPGWNLNCSWGQPEQMSPWFALSQVTYSKERHRLQSLLPSLLQAVSPKKCHTYLLCDFGWATPCLWVLVSLSVKSRQWTMTLLLPGHRGGVNVLWKLNMMLMMLTWEGLASQFKIQKSDLLSRFQSHPRARSSATSYPLLHKSWAQAPVSVEKSPPDPSSVYLCKEPATFGPWELFVHLLPSVGPGSGPIQMWINGSSWMAKTLW